MIRQQLEQYLGAQDFFPLPSKLQELSAFVKVERNFVNVLQLIDYKSNLYLSPHQYEEIKDTVRLIFREKGLNEVHILTVILAEDMEKADNLALQDSFCWMIDTKAPALVIKEGSAHDFYGMRGLLQTFIDTYEERPDEPVEIQGSAEKSFTLIEKITDFIHHMPVITVILVAINILAYLLCLMKGGMVYSVGETGLDFLRNGEWYRLLTAIFLHGDLNHIFSNMILLYFLGAMLEPQLGRIGFLFIYMVSGILGNLVSVAYEMVSGIHYVSFGASGAVYALIGATLLLVIRHNKALKISLLQMVLLIIYCLYSSFAGENINAAAHIGGLMAGFILTFIVCKARREEQA